MIEIEIKKYLKSIKQLKNLEKDLKKDTNLYIDLKYQYKYINKLFKKLIKRIKKLDDEKSLEIIKMFKIESFKSETTIGNEKWINYYINLNYDKFVEVKYKNTLNKVSKKRNISQNIFICIFLPFGS